MISGKPDLVATLQSEGLELKQRGHSFWVICPFHSERTSSLKIDPDRQTFHCFGCDAHGDVIDFIQQYRSLLFKDAIAYLGMTAGRLDRQALQRIEHEKIKRQAVEAFRVWCDDRYAELADLYRLLQQKKGCCKAWEDVERIAQFYHEESLWTLHMEILSGPDDRAKFELFQEVGRHAA